MLRLSIIVPHQHNDSDLENTILSALEHRPKDCEIILVHDGSYSDPYQLGDELLLLHEEADNPVALLNAGLAVARSPIICVLSGGVTVQSDDWAEQACQRLTSKSNSANEPASLAVGIATTATQCSYGLRMDAVNSGSVLRSGDYRQRHVGLTCGPELTCGFYLRRMLLAVGGWNESVQWANADVELALLMNRLGIPSQLLEGDCVKQSQATSKRTAANIKQLAELAVAYGLQASGAGAAAVDFLRGCLTGNFSGSLAWARGTLSADANLHIQQRIKSASDRWQQLQQPTPVRHAIGDLVRRAA
ncbi:MAG: glycosyltransferase family 2 protein [Pirellulaceae bacterium]|nr:glycosyltransferase family 2 protein [Pirellulaceae bacterium]